MPTIAVEVSEEVAANLAELVLRCSLADAERGGATTHGPLAVSDLLAMLAEDAAMAIGRPGSWEAGGMAQVLSSHGYEI